MKNRKLGRTGLMVSEVCLGTMVFGDQLSEAESTEIFNKAIDCGINFIDTADVVYARGRSEEIVGKLLKGMRQAMVLATKVGMPTGPSINDIGLSRKHIMDGIEGSLRRLDTDYVDLYYVHYWDEATPIEETLSALDEIVKQGKVRYIGCSNFFAWQLCKSLSVSELHNMARFECIQSPYNLITRDIENEIFPLCNRERVGIVVYNPLAGGFLTGKHQQDKPPDKGRFTHERMGSSYMNRYWNPSNFEAVTQFEKLARRHGCSLPQFSLAWILSNEQITTTIMGSSSVQQLEENLKATEISLSEEEQSACDEIWHQLQPPRFFYGSQQLKRSKTGH